jgi:hypothetical protein
MTTTYIAIQDIYVARGVRAFSKGEVVPTSVVENLSLQSKVASQRTDAAKDAVQGAAAKAAVPQP